MSETVRIQGATILRLTDQLSHSLYIAPGRFLKILLIYLALFAVIFTLLMWTHFAGFIDLLQCQCYAAARRELMNGLFIPLIWLFATVVAAVILDALFQIVKYLRLPLANRKISYSIGDNDIEMCDEAGFSRKIPWGSVGKFTRFHGIFLLRTKPKYWTTVPVRAFSAGDQDAFARLAVRAVKP